MAPKKIKKAVEKNTHWKNLFPYEYLGAFNLAENEEVIGKIVKIEKETIVGTDGSKEDLPVLYFESGVPKMVLNRTNSRLITKALGSAYIDKWIGRSIQIFATKVKSFGEVVDAIRIRDFAPKMETDIEPALLILESSESSEELKKNFQDLPLEQKGDARVIAKKDELKAKFAQNVG